MAVSAPQVTSPSEGHNALSGGKLDYQPGSTREMWRALLCGFALADWQSCLADLGKHELAFFHGKRCDVAFVVHFDWPRYAKRVRTVEAVDSLSICAPVSCTAEMVTAVVTIARKSFFE